MGRSDQSWPKICTIFTTGILILERLKKFNNEESSKVHQASFEIFRDVGVRSYDPEATRRNRKEDSSIPMRKKEEYLWKCKQKK